MVLQPRPASAGNQPTMTRPAAHLLDVAVATPHLTWQLPDSRSEGRLPPPPILAPWRSSPPPQLQQPPPPLQQPHAFNAPYPRPPAPYALPFNAADNPGLLYGQSHHVPQPPSIQPYPQGPYSPALVTPALSYAATGFGHPQSFAASNQEGQKPFESQTSDQQTSQPSAPFTLEPNYSGVPMSQPVVEWQSASRSFAGQGGFQNFYIADDVHTVHLAHQASTYNVQEYYGQQHASESFASPTQDASPWPHDSYFPDSRAVVTDSQTSGVALQHSPHAFDVAAGLALAQQLYHVARFAETAPYQQVQRVSPALPRAFSQQPQQVSVAGGTAPTQQPCYVPPSGGSVSCQQAQYVSPVGVTATSQQHRYMPPPGGAAQQQQYMSQTGGTSTSQQAQYVSPASVRSAPSQQPPYMSLSGETARHQHYQSQAWGASASQPLQHVPRPAGPLTLQQQLQQIPRPAEPMAPPQPLHSLPTGETTAPQQPPHAASTRTQQDAQQMFKAAAAPLADKSPTETQEFKDTSGVDGVWKELEIGPKLPSDVMAMINGCLDY